MALNNLNLQQLNQANIANLTSLWQRYGAQQLGTVAQHQLWQNSSWPHRVWLTEDEHKNADTPIKASDTDITDLLRGLRPDSILPLWPENISNNSTADIQTIQKTAMHYIREHWYLSFEQTAMYLPINNELFLAQHNNALNIVTISKNQDLATWVAVGSSAFGYQIAPSVIKALSLEPNISLLLAWLDETPVACGLLYQTGNIIGVHQVGIAPDFQGKGLAKQFMTALLDRCIKMSGEYVVLQASAAGKPLYQKLGFTSQFTISNYHKRE